MDERLIEGEPRRVMRLMAESYLATPAISDRQGAITLAPHQVDAAARLLNLLGDHGGAVLADATGLGKTFVAIAVARTMPSAMVVAPAALRGMWRDSLKRTGVDAVVESYEALSRGTAPRVRAALLILDEAHHARSPRARRYAVLADLAWGAKVLLLTATPIHNTRGDLRSLVALFLGSRAHAMSDDELRALIVRRTAGSVKETQELPSISRPAWFAVPGNPDTLRAINALPAAVPLADGAPAHALMRLGLIRAWTSSDAALRASLRRRLRRSAAVTASLEQGRLPDRNELESSLVVDDAIQLGFPELLVANRPMMDVSRLRATLDRHGDGVRAILATLDRSSDLPDDARVRILRDIRTSHRTAPVVAFSQFADTATAAFRALASSGGVALVTGNGARVASGPVAVEEIVNGFDTADHAPANAMPLELLIATDVLSEGLSLRRAGVIVHLDLPWTIARLEQRVGRLRRLGSRHRCVSVYAIGPPVASRELMSVVRALQRKARLASSVSGIEELMGSLPLLGDRLSSATAKLAQHDDSGAIERLRHALTSWLTDVPVRQAAGPLPTTNVALGLASSGVASKLVVFNGDAASERPSDILTAVQWLSAWPPRATCRAERIPGGLLHWLDEERGRTLARLVSGAPSAAHVATLRALEQALSQATRPERAALSLRVARCRQLVMSARGVGAERALARFLAISSPPDLDALEQLLASRAPLLKKSADEWKYVALLIYNAGVGELHGFLDSRK